jgi:lipopolysaccharide transport system ATP-binding protein
VSVALHGGASHLLDNYEWWDRALTFQVLAGDEPVRIGVCNLEMNETLVRRT